jgi:hypothetical protein
MFARSIRCDAAPAQTGRLARQMVVTNWLDAHGQNPGKTARDAGRVAF